MKSSSDIYRPFKKLTKKTKGHGKNLYTILIDYRITLMRNDISLAAELLLNKKIRGILLVY